MQNSSQIPDSKPQWAKSRQPVDYASAVAFMEDRVAQIRAGTARELVWLLEHPPVITGGTSAKQSDLLQPDRFPVHNTGRGGQYTYHGPGQRVVYVMLDLNQRGKDVRGFVHKLEDWVIDTLAEFGLAGVQHPDRVGVWVPKDDNFGNPSEAKIAALGIRVRKWVSFHGMAINVEPDLGHFTAIVPCGIKEFGVTSFADLGLSQNMDDLDAALLARFQSLFGPVEMAEPPFP